NVGQKMDQNSIADNTDTASTTVTIRSPLVAKIMLLRLGNKRNFIKDDENLSLTVKEKPRELGRALGIVLWKSRERIKETKEIPKPPCIQECASINSNGLF